MAKGGKVSWGISPRRKTGRVIEKRRFSSLVRIDKRFGGGIKEFRNRILTWWD